MATISLQSPLMEQLQQVASEQATPPEKLLETAVRTFLRQLEREKIKTEADAFRSRHAELAEKYMGQYVAIHHGEMVDHDQDFQTLHSRIRRRFGRQAVLLWRVRTEPERILTLQETEELNGQEPAGQSPPFTSERYDLALYCASCTFLGYAQKPAPVPPLHGVGAGTENGTDPEDLYSGGTAHA